MYLSVLLVSITRKEANHMAMQTADYCGTDSSCAVEQPTAAQVQLCPACGKKGKQVGRETVKAMLAVSLHEIRPDSTYRFCASEDCPIVYFANDCEQTLTEGDLRERVHQKHPDNDDVFVCYCFRHTPGSIRAELLATGQSTVVETITQGTKLHQCACELRNPQGSCCLGNVGAAVKRVRQELDAVTVL